MHIRITFYFLVFCINGDPASWIYFRILMSWNKPPCRKIILDLSFFIRIITDARALTVRNLSVPMSIRHVLILCLNETIIKLFSPPGRPNILVYEPNQRFKIPRKKRGR